MNQSLHVAGRGLAEFRGLLATAHGRHLVRFQVGLAWRYAVLGARRPAVRRFYWHVAVAGLSAVAGPGRLPIPGRVPIRAYG